MKDADERLKRRVADWLDEALRDVTEESYNLGYWLRAHNQIEAHAAESRRDEAVADLRQAIARHTYSRDEVRRMLKDAVRYTRQGGWPCVLTESKNTPRMIADAILAEHDRQRADTSAGQSADS